MVTLILILLVVIFLAGDVTDKLFFLKKPFLLCLVVSVLLFIDFSIYFLQPNLMTGPAYATADAYRDYANAHIISRLSRIDVGAMIGERYYKSFPVVPLEIASVSVITGLPISVAHLLFAMLCEGATVASLFLVSQVLVNRHDCSGVSSVGFLSILVVLLQPVFIQPMWVLTPIRFSIAFGTLAFYLIYSKVIFSARKQASTFVLIVMLILVIPLHAASAMSLIALLATAALFTGGGGCRISLLRMTTISLLCFFVYLLFSANMPVISLLTDARMIYDVLVEIFLLGPAIVGEKALASVGSVGFAEVGPFMASVWQALIFSICTVFLMGVLKRQDEVVQERNLRLLHLCYALLLVVTLGGGYVLHLWEIGAMAADPRYFNYPLTPVVLIATVSVLTWILRNVGCWKKLMLFGLLTLYVVSMTTSPLFLHETDPAYARLMPTESERTAARFVSTSLDTEQTSQIVTDWPFYSLVYGVLGSEHIDIAGKVSMPILYWEPIQPGGTVMLSRRYYVEESAYLRNTTPHLVRPLSDVREWKNFNKILDVFSTSVYVGNF
jgi:hypothetical protein